MNREGRLILVSNRLPVTVARTAGEVEIQPSSGGLISALLPLLKTCGGCWIGWPGTDHDAAIDVALRSEGGADFQLEPVFLSRSEKQCFYDGCCNEILWPLFHDLQSRCNFDPLYWSSYLEVNETFADAVELVAARNDFVWVHDYHLMLLADCLRSRGVRARVAYFHHIPFPPPDVFEKLPWRAEILRGLLRFSALGFQTDRDRRNFFACVRRYLHSVQIKRIGGRFRVSAEGRSTEAGTFPISIDYERLARESRSPEILAEAAQIRRDFSDRKLILGIDRLDYTKGIPERLIAFRTLLEQRPELRGQVALLQVTVPSREQIPKYQECKIAVERLVSEINGEFGGPGWAPVTYVHRSVPHSRLLALYRAAHVALVTPLKDGMNLIAKEFCAARSDEQSVLVLSEFAGSAVELSSGALLVNPYDFEGVAAALYEALGMPEFNQRIRMQAMRRMVQANDVFRWRRNCCRQAPLLRAIQVAAQSA
ncbi:MAG TPA: trehalose-6-phosphate synthase [Terriglobales bacterium]|nr:trehalose-6-phosphate synthase [Terriglobales bacterium]